MTGPKTPSIRPPPFKARKVPCLPAEERTAVFHSSGTTGQRPSRHLHNADSLAIYEASLLSWFKANFRNAQERLVMLTPPLAEAPHSSLVYMFETLRRQLGSADSVYLGHSD